MFDHQSDLILCWDDTFVFITPIALQIYIANKIAAKPLDLAPTETNLAMSQAKTL